MHTAFTSNYFKMRYIIKGALRGTSRTLFYPFFVLFQEKGNSMAQFNLKHQLGSTFCGRIFAKIE